MISIDKLISASWIATVDPDDTLLTDHSIAIQGNEIVQILPTTDALNKYQPAKHIELNGHLLTPGLINAHTHAAMSLFRGLADDLPLMEWLNDHIWPAEAKWVNDNFVEDGTRLAVAEMIRSGTTCFNDMYFMPNITADVCVQAGMRACVGLIVIDFPTVWAKDADEYIQKGLQIHDQYRDEPLISTAFAPHAPYSVSDEPLKRLSLLAEEMDIPVHCHIHETSDEINSSIRTHDKRPLERFNDLGLLNPHLIAVHMTHLEDEEIQTSADNGLHVIHCPESNMKLASGFCPVQLLLDKNVNVALGTDGAASNNDLNMIGEMRSAAYLGKASSNNAAAVSATQVLRMATLNGAKALGLDDKIGSLEEGKQADIIALDLNRIETQPVYHPISQMVYAAGRQQVTNVWIAGQQLLRNKKLTRIDEDKLLKTAAEWQLRLQSDS